MKVNCIYLFSLEIRYSGKFGVVAVCVYENGPYRRLIRPLLEIQEAEATELLNRLQFRTDLFEHGLRVANFAVEIAREIDLSSQTQEEIRIASIFHDTGKLFIPNASNNSRFKRYLFPFESCRISGTVKSFVVIQDPWAELP